MAKGWKPTIVDGGGASATGAPPSPTPAPRRTRGQIRRERAAREPVTPVVDAIVAASPRQPVGSVRAPGVEGAEGRLSLGVQLGDRWSRIVRDVRNGEYTWQEFVDKLDDEEIARAQLKDSKGGFRGRPPGFVPREFVLACQRDQKRRFEELFSKDVLAIAKKYLELAQSDNLKDETKAKMMQYAMERMFGGIPKDIKISQEQPWEQMVVNVVSDGDEGMPEHLARRYGGYTERQGGGATNEE